jgi:hypothetical protein
MNHEIVLLYLIEVMEVHVTIQTALFVGFSLLMVAVIIAVRTFRISRSTQGE